jgi:hypothetical protein
MTIGTDAFCLMAKKKEGGVVMTRMTALHAQEQVGPRAVFSSTMDNRPGYYKKRIHERSESVSRLKDRLKECV